MEYTQSKQDNLTRNEYTALTNLMSRTDIVFYKADKGSYCLRVQYVKNGLKQLSGTTVYDPPSKDIPQQQILTKLYGLNIAGMLGREMTEF